MPKSTKQPKTAPVEVKDLKPTVISFIHKIKKFPVKPKKSVLRKLGQKNVFIRNTRKGKNEIYDFIELLFKHNKLSIADNKKILLEVAKKVELEPESPELEHKLGPTSRHQS